MTLHYLPQGHQVLSVHGPSSHFVSGFSTFEFDFGNTKEVQVAERGIQGRKKGRGNKGKETREINTEKGKDELAED